MIDTSVLRAASGVDASSEVASSCGLFLEAVFKICHQVVKSNAISLEWTKDRPERPWNPYMSIYSLKWLSWMKSRGKIHKMKEETYSQDLRDDLEESQNTDQQKESVLKDAFLVEAALNADLILVSLDESLKKLLKRSVSEIPEIGKILWVNPTKENDTFLRWLEDGAPFEEKWALEYDRS